MIFFDLAVKTVLVLGIFGVLISSVSFSRLLAALEALRLPRPAAAMLMFARSYILLLGHEGYRFVIAAKCRGAEQGSRIRKLRAVAAVTPHLILRVLERGGRIYIAMLARGYTGEMGLPVFSRLTLAAPDYCFSAAFIAALALIFLLA